MKAKGGVSIGTSGYAYKHWTGSFYPRGLRQQDWLAHYAPEFDTVEINTTFYRTPNQETVAAWYRNTPARFRFVIKGSRIITRIR